jgi:uncharacterized repeat protein (TIGR01451 family)
MPYTFKARINDTANQITVVSGSGLTTMLPVEPIIIPPVIPEEKKSAGLLVTSFFVENSDNLKAGDSIRFFYSVENSGDLGLKNIIFSAAIPELGIKAPAQRLMKLASGNSVSKLQYIDLPSDTAPGTYYLQLSIISKDVRRIIYRELIVNA